MTKNVSQKSAPAVLKAATAVECITHEQKIKIFQQNFIVIKMDKLSPAATEKHQVPSDTCRLESRTTCACCGEEMKLEWIDLHLQQKHDMSIHEYVEILILDDGSLQQIEVPKATLTHNQERLNNAVNKFKFKK